MDGPLTDYESFDSDPGSDCGLSDGEACPSGGEPPPAGPPPSRKRKRREHSRSNRREKRQRIRETEGGGLKGVSRKRQLEGARDAIQVPYCLGDEARVSSSGWIGRHAVASPLEGRSLQELLASEDLAYFPWDGRQTHLLVDKEGYVIGALCGPPKGLGWREVQRAAFRALDKASTYFSKRPQKTNRRGAFPSVAYGISYGGGQQKPGHLSHSQKANKILTGLLNSPPIQRICNYASHCFMVYGKRNHEHMRSKMDDLRANDPSLKRLYDDKIGAYPCRSFNLGRQTATQPHIDSANLAQSWCSITPIGSFDPKVGGHLVLRDLGIVVEFPPGSTILIPSALITHYNTPVRPNETRFSIVQYAAGGLFRWVENGFKTDAAWEAGASKDEAEARKSHDGQRWRGALSAFTSLRELLPT